METGKKTSRVANATKKEALFDLPCLHYITRHLKRGEQIEYYGYVAGMFAMDAKKASDASYVLRAAHIFDSPITLEEMEQYAGHCFAPDSRMGCADRNVALKYIGSRKLRNSCCLYCKYSKDFKNDNEGSERLVLHYVLDTGECFSALRPEHFPSYAPLTGGNDTSTLPYININSLIYEACVNHYGTPLDKKELVSSLCGIISAQVDVQEFPSFTSFDLPSFINNHVDRIMEKEYSSVMQVKMAVNTLATCRKNKYKAPVAPGLVGKEPSECARVRKAKNAKVKKEETMDSMATYGLLSGSILSMLQTATFSGLEDNENHNPEDGPAPDNTTGQELSEGIASSADTAASPAASFPEEVTGPEDSTVSLGEQISVPGDAGSSPEACTEGVLPFSSASFLPDVPPDVAEPSTGTEPPSEQTELPASPLSVPSSLPEGLDDLPADYASGLEGMDVLEMETSALSAVSLDVQADSTGEPPAASTEQEESQVPDIEEPSAGTEPEPAEKDTFPAEPYPALLPVAAEQKKRKEPSITFAHVVSEVRKAYEEQRERELAEPEECAELFLPSALYETVDQRLMKKLLEGKRHEMSYPSVVLTPCDLCMSGAELTSYTLVNAGDTSTYLSFLSACASTGNSVPYQELRNKYGCALCPKDGPTKHCPYRPVSFYSGKNDVNTAMAAEYPKPQLAAVEYQKEDSYREFILSDYFCGHITYIDEDDYVGLGRFISALCYEHDISMEYVEYRGVDGLLIFAGGRFFFLYPHEALKKSMAIVLGDADRCLVHSFNPVGVYRCLQEMGLTETIVHSISALFSVAHGLSVPAPAGIIFAGYRYGGSIEDIYAHIMPHYGEVYERLAASLTPEQKRTYRLGTRLERALGKSIDISRIAYGHRHGVLGGSFLHYRITLSHVEDISHPGVLYLLHLKTGEDGEELLPVYEAAAGRIGIMNTAELRDTCLIGLTKENLCYYSCYNTEAALDALLGALRYAYRDVYHRIPEIDVDITSFVL